jgi:hypothetical protein
MNALFGVAVVTGLIYGIFVDGTYFKIYLAVLAFYTIVFNHLLINKKQTTKRKNIMITTWNCKLSYLFINDSSGRPYCLLGY